MSKCQSCGEELVEGAKFCIICGATVQKQPEQAKAETAKEGEEQEPEKEKTGKEEFCASCNAPLRKGASFCVSCGASVEKTKKQSDLEVLKTLEEYLGTSGKKEAESRPAAAGQEEDLQETEESHKKAADPAKESAETVGEKVAEIKEAESRRGADKGDYQEKHEALEDWTVVFGEKPVGEAEELDLLTASKSVVSKVVFPETYRGNRAILNGKVKCHECNKLTIFSLEADRGWGASNDPVTCPCGKDIEIGEYWSDSDNAIYVWASLVEGDLEDEECPLSISVNKVMEI